VWSLALRRTDPPAVPEVAALGEALEQGDLVFTTGLVLQELLQGFRGPKARDAIIHRFASLPFLVPERSDYIEAAEVRNECRRGGVQIGTIDALLAGLCLSHGLTILTTDNNFHRIADILPLSCWRGAAS
jgi:predicted nucleic acid-binding protein